MEMTELNIQVPSDDARFIEEYAARAGRSVSEVLEEYIRQLRSSRRPQIHPALEAITGLLPAELDVKEEYARGLLGKHR